MGEDENLVELLSGCVGALREAGQDGLADRLEAVMWDVASAPHANLDA